MVDDPILEQAQNQAESEPEVLEIESGTGQVFKGTKDEIIEQMKNSVANGSRTIREQKERERQMSQEIENLKKPAATSNGYDKKKYFEMLAEDPKAAADYIDEYRYGMPSSEVKARLDRSQSVAERIQLQNEYDAFAASIPRGSLDTEDATKIHNYMEQNRFPVSAVNLKLAYYELRESGQIKPKELVDEGEEGIPRRKAPPSARGIGGGEGRKGFDAAKATPAEIKAEMERIQRAAR